MAQVADPNQLVEWGKALGGSLLAVRVQDITEEAVSGAEARTPRSGTVNHHRTNGKLPTAGGAGQMTDITATTTVHNSKMTKPISASDNRVELVDNVRSSARAGDGARRAPAVQLRWRAHHLDMPRMRRRRVRAAASGGQLPSLGRLGRGAISADTKRPPNRVRVDGHRGFRPAASVGAPFAITLRFFLPPPADDGRDQADAPAQNSHRERSCLLLRLLGVSCESPPSGLRTFRRFM